MRNHRLVRLLGAVGIGIAGLTGTGVLVPSLGSGIAGAVSCSAAGSTGLTASVIATTSQTITSPIDATGCDLGIYVGPGVTGVTINNATVTGANDHGIFAQDTSGLTVTNSTVSGNGVAPTAGIDENKAIELVGVSNSTVSGQHRDRQPGRRRHRGGRRRPGRPRRPQPGDADAHRQRDRDQQPEQRQLRRVRRRHRRLRPRAPG